MPTKPINLIEQDHQEFFAELFSPLKAENVLDVASGPGGFTGILAENLGSFTRITGIDLSQAAIDRANETFEQEDVAFEVMDAADLQYPDDSYDLVSCAFSLHHLPDPATVLAEIRRVLKPGGTGIFVEMYRDHLTETQQTESILHHWAGEIDTALGITHRQTYLREEILEIVAPEAWGSAQIFDVADVVFDPKGEEITNLIMSTIDRVAKRAEELPDQAIFEQRAEEIRQRMKSIGAHISTRLVILVQN